MASFEEAQHASFTANIHYSCDRESEFQRGKSSTSPARAKAGEQACHAW
jgi:hypothetical protein